MTVKKEPALDEVLLRPLVEAALTEDLGRRGDVTSQATIPADMQAQLQIKARQAGVICGMDLARLSFALVDAHIEFMAQVHDGQNVAAGPPRLLSLTEGGGWRQRIAGGALTPPREFRLLRRRPPLEVETQA